MSVVLGIIGVAVLVVIHMIFNQKIDEEEKRALSTPRTATFIRTNFPEIVEVVSSVPSVQKEFERADLIRFDIPNASAKVILQQWSGMLHVIIVKNSSVQREWEVSKNGTTESLLQEIESAVLAIFSQTV